ncbi:MAG: hypothetical protein CME06_01105 [Gemmatimonadetes bacterium]|nr:hypothetical protein [Gemmatimonadota bacterium]
MRRLALPLASTVLAATIADAEVRISIGTESPDQLPPMIAEMIREHGATLRHTLPRLAAASFVVEDTAVLDRIRCNSAIAEVADYIELVGRASVPRGEVPYDIAFEPGVRRRPVGTYNPDDPDYSKQWPISCIQADKAWDVIQGGNVTIAIVDTGIDLYHEDLRSNCNTVDDWDFVNNDDFPLDDYGHGTHVGGIASAIIDNGAGIAGCFQATLLAVKVLDSNGYGWWDDVAAGIDHSVEKGADVINMSLGGGSDDSLLKAACDAAYAAGVLVVAAAGNDGPLFFANYPANYTSVIGVGALGGFIFGDCEKAAFFSQRGFGDDNSRGNVEVMAPGKFVYSCYPNDEYTRMDGTSMAAPHVAALCAAYRAYVPSWSAEQIRHHIQANADNLGGKFTFGYGRIDFFPPID